MSDLSKRIELEFTDESSGLDRTLTFNVSPLDYNEYINNLKHDDKVAPANNFVMQVLEGDEHKDFLRGMISGGLGLEIAAELLKQYKPKVRFAVKKSKPVQNTSKATE